MKPSIETLLEIKFQNEIDSTEQNKRYIQDLFLEILNIARKRKIWDSRIKKIIVSDNFKKDAQTQAKIWKIGLNEPSERGSLAFSKTLRNPYKKRDEFYLFFPIVVINERNVSMYLYLVLGQMSMIAAKKIIPVNIIQDDKGQSLNDYLRRASIEWCKVNYSQILTQGIITSSSLLDHGLILTAFKRKLKRILYRYNSGLQQTSEGLWEFWLSYYKSIETLFIDILRNFEGNRTFESREDKEISNLIYRVTDEISSLTTKCLQGQDFNFRDIKNSLIVFSNHFQITLIENEQDEDFLIYFSKNPKDYFVDLVDTEPRIVCFIDILGFSDLINSYDEDLTSTALQDIQESFSLAQKRLFDDAPNINKELIKHLRYQSFSDNICISVPYFDNERDFVFNFNLLTTYVRSFQLVMMTKGFYVRGGISLGSFYSNQNIIFSKGLVKAYYLESKKAIYPRVIIDPEIIQKLDNFDADLIIGFDLNNSIIFDWENAAFLNPFGLVDNNGVRSEFVPDEEGRNDYMFEIKNNLREVLSDFLKGYSQEGISEFELIKQDVAANINRYFKDGNIATKYIWLLEFMKWWEGDESGSLKFRYFL